VLTLDRLTTIERVKQLRYKRRETSMNFEITEEQAMIRDTIRDFAEKEVAPVSRDNNRNEHFPLDLINKLGEMGVLGLNLPSEYGGGGADYISYCIMLENIYHALLVARCWLA